MRKHALVFGGLALSFLLPSTGANAFFWLLDPAYRQPQQSTPYYGGQAGYGAGPGYRYEPGGRGYGVWRRRRLSAVATACSATGRRAARPADANRAIPAWR